MNLKEKLSLRKEILDFLNGMEEKKLLNKNFQFLEKNLNLKERKITKKEVESIANLTFPNKFSFEREDHKDFILLDLKTYFSSSEGTSKRIWELSKKYLEEMDKEELIKVGIDLISMDLEKFEKIINKTKSKNNLEKHSFNNPSWALKFQDSLYIFNILIAVHKFDPRSLITYILKKDYPSLGYFENSFKQILEFRTLSKKINEPNIEDFIYIFEEEYDKNNNRLKEFNQFEKKLSLNHKVAPPDKFLKINLNSSPLEVEFNNEGQLVVLHQSKDPLEDNRLCLSIYNSKGGFVRKKITNCRAIFEGTILGTTSFSGNLNIGSNNLIYVNGGDCIFNQDLEEVVDDKFEGIKKLLYLQENFKERGSIFGVHEREGLYYLLVRPKSQPSWQNNGLIMAKEDKILHSLEFFPIGGSHNSWDDPNADLGIGKEFLFLKVNNTILKIKKDLSKESISKRKDIFENISLSGGNTPSNLCLTPNENLLIVNQYVGEPVQSIKLYSNKGEIEFLTHFYPEDIAGGFANIRSLAVSKDGVLAHTCVQEHEGSIDLYKLKE